MSQPFLADKTAIITGASSGIGRATAIALARAGARVVLAARSADKLEALAAEIAEAGGQALPYPMDVTDRSQVAHLVSAALERWGQVDLLIACAGEYIRTPVRAMRAEHFEESLRINFYGALYPVLELLPHMLERRQGHIVLISSMDAQKGMPLDVPYVAAKYALRGLGEVMRQELHGSGVEVTTVFPGRVDTPLIDYMDVPWISAKIPPERVAKAILRAIRRRQPEVIVPFHVRALIYVNTLSPRCGDWLVRVLHLEGRDRRQMSKSGATTDKNAY